MYVSKKKSDKPMMQDNISSTRITVNRVYNSLLIFVAIMLFFRDFILKRVGIISLSTVMMVDENIV